MLYIAFVLLAMMNVITGIFVESAIKQAEGMKDRNFREHVRRLYAMSETCDHGQVHRHQFDEWMNDPVVKDQMKNLGINVEDANTLFTFLDDDDSGAIDLEELINGLTRLRAGAKFLDVMTMLHEMENQRNLLSNYVELYKGDADLLQKQFVKFDKRILDHTSPSASAPSAPVPLPANFVPVRPRPAVPVTQPNHLDLLPWLFCREDVEV
jgi:hypothetical protein